MAEIASNNPFKGMRRDPARGWVAGVCAGIAQYYDWNAKIVRLMALVLCVTTGFWPVFCFYCILWYVLDPRAPLDELSGLPPNATAPGSTRPLRARLQDLEERLRRVEAGAISDEFRLRREFRKLA